MLQRRRVRRSLSEWCRYVGYEPARHHLALIQRLEAVARGDIKNLAVFMPPGSAKSTYASILFPPWVMANASTWGVLAASHTTELAEKWGRRVRNLVGEHASTLGLQLSDDSQAAGRWALASGGEYFAAGVGTGIAGFRAKLGIIDDPIRTRQDADSELIRNRIWEWYINDFTTRLVPGARKVLIQTRWHEDDLAGRALQHEDWEVLSLPAVAEDNDPLGRFRGEPLWSEGDYGYGEQLIELQARTPPRTWSALYQQRPAPEEGDYFKASWLVQLEAMPDPRMLRVYGASDYAVTSNGGDYTVHIVVGIDAQDRMYVLDMWRGQTSSDEWVEAFCDLVEQWKPIGWAEETGQIKAGVGPFIVKRMRERRLFCFREAFPTRGDKAVRAQSIRGRMAMNSLYVPAHAPWVGELLREMMSFPAGKHDDQVDALGLIGQILDKMVKGRAMDERPSIAGVDPLGRAIPMNKPLPKPLQEMSYDEMHRAMPKRGRERL